MPRIVTKKLPKGVSQEFLDSLNTLSTDQLKGMIVTLQLQNEENNEFKESPQFVAAKEEFDIAKDRFDMVAGPVRDTATSLKNKTKVVIERLKEKGGA